MGFSVIHLEAAAAMVAAAGVIAGEAVEGVMAEGVVGIEDYGGGSNSVGVQTRTECDPNCFT